MKSLFLMFSLVLSSFVVYASVQLSDTNPAPKQQNTSTPENFERSAKAKDAKINKPFTMLVLGTDRASFDENSRSDTMMLAIIDPINNEVNIMSIYRDLYAFLPDQGHYDKINAAYSHGGVDSSIDAVENYFDIEIDHYAVINFSGFVDLIDSLDGINIDVEKDIIHNNPKDPNYAEIQEGERTLNGKEALTYARFRSDDEGDFGRTRRQKQVIQSLLSESISVKNIPKMKNAYDAVVNNYDSSLSKSDIFKLAFTFRSMTKSNINTFGFDAESVGYNGISYVEPLPGELESAKSLIKELLND